MKFKKFQKNLKIQNSIDISYSGVENLKQVENGLTKYNNHLCKIFVAVLERESPKILDFGAGTGALADLIRKSYQFTPDCLEIDPTLIQMILAKKLNVIKKLVDINSKYDLIYSSNVFEHILNDKDTFESLINHLNVGGKIIIHVPAFKVLYSKLDFNLGHIRRYSKKDLIRLVKDTELKILKTNYDDVLGFFVLFVLKFVGLMNYMSKKNSNDSVILKIYDTIIFPISNFLDKLGFKHIIGKNLILIAEKV